MTMLLRAISEMSSDGESVKHAGRCSVGSLLNATKGRRTQKEKNPLE
jgi:hypothetical protein